MGGLGRLLILGRKVTPLKKMEDYIHPQHFNHVIQAVKKVVGFNENRKPTLATKLGQSIQRDADIMASMLFRPSSLVPEQWKEAACLRV